MLNYYKLDYIPEIKEEHETIKEKCKKIFIKFSSIFTIIINILFFMFNIYITYPYFSKYYNNNLIGYIFRIMFESIFIILTIIFYFCIN